MENSCDNILQIMKETMESYKNIKLYNIDYSSPLVLDKHKIKNMYTTNYLKSIELYYSICNKS